MAARAGLLGHRRGHRVRAAGQDRAARPRRRGEGPLRERAAAQGVLPQRAGTGTSRRVLEDLELSRRTAHTAPRRRQLDMAAGWIEQKRHYRRYKARIAQLPASYRTAVAALERYANYLGGLGDGASILSMLDDLADLFEQG